MDLTKLFNGGIEVSKQPITQKQYDESVMIADFLTEIRETYEEHCIKFTPLIYGYDVAIRTKSGVSVVSIRKPTYLSKYFKVEVRKESKIKRYKFKEKSEIKTIIQKIDALI